MAAAPAAVRGGDGVGRAAFVVGGGGEGEGEGDGDGDGDGETVAGTFGPETGSGSGTALMLVIDGGACGAWVGGDDGDGGGSDALEAVTSGGGGGKSDFELFASSRNATASAQIDSVAAAETAATTMTRRFRRLSSST